MPKRFLLATTTLCVGFGLGAVSLLVVLYEKPGKNLVWKVGRLLEQGGVTTPQAANTQAWGVRDAYKVELHASGFDYPVRICFPPPDAFGSAQLPFYYVAELGGSIKVVTASGEISTFCEGLLNYQRVGMDELGLLGLVYDPGGRQFFATMSYWDEAGGVFRNKVERLGCSGDGLSMTDRTVVLDMQDEMTVASYQIQFCALGPDGHLYVGVGSGADKADAQDLDKFAGKVLRLRKDGRAVEDNPFYDPARPDAARSYVYAYGLRNPFDIAWDPRSGVPVVSDVGPGIDRIVRLEPGVNYCFRDDENQIRANALYTWGPGTSYAPVGVTFAPDDSLGDELAHDLFVGLFGQVHVPGPNDGKRICNFDFAPSGHLESHARDLVTYGGNRFASVVDVEWGPDGIYFSDIYGESIEPHTGGGVVYRIVQDAGWTSASAQLPQTASTDGETVYRRNRCDSCHAIDGEGGREGPDLSRAGEALSERLLSPAYEAWVGELTARPGEYFQRHREAYAELLSLDGRARIVAWLGHHLHDPRFDNPKAKMPSFGFLSPGEVRGLAEYLLSLP